LKITGLKTQNPVANDLPKEVISEVTVNRDKIVIREQSKPTQTLKLPKSGQVKIVTNKEGVEPQVEVEKASWMPNLVCLPQLGICASKQIEPLLGVQFVRCEPIQTGIGVALTPSLVGLTLEKDILDNASVGLLWGYDKELHQTVGLVFSLFL
jgi:hypothetical protein